VSRVGPFGGEEEGDVISIVHEAEAVVDQWGRECMDWVIVAECLYGFDEPTARRLAFIRWLHATGRIGADDSHAGRDTPI
jgi:hypothetical protein